MTAVQVRPLVRNYPKEVNDEYRAFLDAGKRAVEHAFRCGELLLEVKASLKHGEFLPWIEKHCEFRERTARNYMGFAARVGNRQALADLGEDAYSKFLPAPASPGGESRAALYSSASDEWATPQALFDVLNAEFGFELDVCASQDNAKCKRYLSANGLGQEWRGVCWMNPPYGDEIPAWIEKAHASASDGATVVCLVPARVDTAWWWDHCAHSGGDYNRYKGVLVPVEWLVRPFKRAA